MANSFAVNYLIWLSMYGANQMLFKCQQATHRPHCWPNSDDEVLEKVDGDPEHIHRPFSDSIVRHRNVFRDLCLLCPPI